MTGILRAILWPEPLFGGKYRHLFVGIGILTGVLAGLAPFFGLRDKVFRTVETSVAVGSCHRDGQAFFVYAREAGIREVLDSIGEEWRLGPFDSNEQPRASLHRIRINGHLLNSAHAAHGAIVREGGGGYSFWSGPTPEKSGIYFSLPSQIKSVDAVSNVTIEWHVSRIPRPVTQVIISVFVAGVIVVCLLTWRAGGSLPAALMWLSLGAIWGHVAGVFLPSISGADGDAMQRLVGEILALWFGLTLGFAVLVWALSCLFRFARIDLPAKGDETGSCFALGAFAPAILLLWLGATWAGPAPFRDWTGDGPASAVMGGRLPFSDAAAWYVGSSAVKDGAKVEWVARRPMHALLRAGELSLAGGDYQRSLIFQTLLVGVSIGGLLVAISRVVSLPAALVASVGLLKYSGGFVGSYLSEASGLAAACVGLALALVGWKAGRVSWRFWGYGILALAVTLRPGPMFILLVFPAAEFLLERGRRWQRALLATVVVGAVIMLASLTFRLIATDEAAPNANSANTVLGIALGTDWATATNRFFSEDPARTKLSTKEMTRQMYLMAWREFRKDPAPALNLMGENLREGLRVLTIDLAQRVTGFPQWTKFFWIMALLMAIGAFWAGERWVGFLALLAAGMVASLPLIWRDGGWRGMTLALPLCFTALAMIGARPSASSSAGHLGILSKYLKGIGLVIASLIGIGALGHTLSKAPKLDLPIVLSGAKDAVLNVALEQAKPRTIGPLSARPTELDSALDQTGLSVYKLDQTLGGFPAPFAIAVVTPNRAKPERSLWLVFPGLSFDSGTKVRVDQYRELPDGYVALVEKWTILE